MSSDEEEYWYDVEELKRPRDHMVDRARETLLGEFFPEDSKEVYYGRQLEVLLEDRFFHWITKSALNELAAEGIIGRAVERREEWAAHFYFSKRHRYPRRQIGETMKLIGEFGAPDFTRAMGIYGEQLFDVGMARIGFHVSQVKVKEVEGITWTQTGHDLDRLVARDGVKYGVEIKNKLGYIDLDEMNVKVQMCAHFGVRPFFVARMMPKSYINEVWRAGGFCLILKQQNYPLLGDDLAKRVRERLKLPVVCIRELPDTTMRRFEAWHEKQLRESKC